MLGCNESNIIFQQHLCKLISDFNIHHIYPILHTDNVFSVKSWCKNRFGMEESSMDKQFGIPDIID